MIGKVSFTHSKPGRFRSRNIGVATVGKRAGPLYSFQMALGDDDDYLNHIVPEEEKDNGWVLLMDEVLFNIRWIIHQLCCHQRLGGKLNVIKSTLKGGVEPGILKYLSTFRQQSLFTKVTWEMPPSIFLVYRQRESFNVCQYIFRGWKIEEW